MKILILILLMVGTAFSAEEKYYMDIDGNWQKERPKAKVYSCKKVKMIECPERFSLSGSWYSTSTTGICYETFGYEPIEEEK